MPRSSFLKKMMQNDDDIRQRFALTHVASSIMIADAKGNIVYLNPAVTSFLQEAEKDIQKDLPRFSVAKLMGANIDVFHKNPSHQRNMLSGMQDTLKTSISVGGRSFNLVANPITNGRGKRIGTMVEWQDGTATGMVDAIDRSQAMIEFQPDGTIVTANKNFLTAMGYGLDEIQGKHHSMFADPVYRASAEYQEFWSALARGEAQTGEFRRFGKGSREIWIQASYSPVMDLRGKVVRVVKTATDITTMVGTRMESERFLNEAVKVLTGMSSGNLTNRMDGEYVGKFADIKLAVNATVEKLIDTMTRIREAAQAVNSAASEIAAGSSDLSMRTEQQASSLEETAASMQEITGTIRQNSKNATSANDLSTNASTIAGDGGKVVEDAVSAMGSIEKSSQKISDIIGVIDEIAFQTNLLALNAAVEAARAGDAGKGFAVVASEVRALAGRSASASKEIKALINESAGQVKAGAQLVNQAGDTLKGIVGSVRQVAGIISEIASASVQQSASLDEINAAVAQMDEMTQQNAALVEENTAAVQSMLEQAKSLDSLISFFQLEEKHSGGMAEASKAASPVLVANHAPLKAAPKPKLAAKKAAMPAKAKTNGAALAEASWEEF